MKKEDLHGFVPAVVTPFNEAGEIMEDAFQSLVEWLIGQGATTICVSGDNGESWALSAAEKGRLTRLAVDISAGRVPVITGCSATTLKNSVDIALAAKENGAGFAPRRARCSERTGDQARNTQSDTCCQVRAARGQYE